MCGITGMLMASAGRVRNAEPQLVASLSALSHRGPDDNGTWSDDYCALGHRRLSIIDLTTAGHQPMADGMGNQIVFNGEIYNFMALRELLRALGHTFQSHSDTEVMLAAYRQWGTACVDHFRGMFAFVLWDSSRKRLFLARDRVGKKPLFYAFAHGSLYFASEIQGMLAFQEVPRQDDLFALDHYLARGYIASPWTAFKGIQKLPPAHFMTVQVDKGALKHDIKPYWSLPYIAKSALSFEESSAQLREVLTEAVRLRMISDVPLGAFLSGGIDSSIVVGLMAKMSNRPVKTFSIGFKNAAYNELEYARIVSGKWGTEHTEFVVEPDAVSILPTLVKHYGEPYCDSSAIPTYYVAKLTREYVTVALTGDGGDESFAGYDRYWASRLSQRFLMFPGAGIIARLLADLLPDSHDFRDPVRRAKRFLQAVQLPMVQRYDQWLGCFSASKRIDLITDDARSEMRKTSPSPEEWMAELFHLSRHHDVVDSCMSADVASYLPFDLLVKVDIATMASSLEARSPFLDHEVMECAARMPVHFKLNGKNTKHILKHTFSDLLPGEIVIRPKSGFGVPMQEWLRGPLNSLMRETLDPDVIRKRGLLNEGFVSRLVEQHSTGIRDHSNQLWCLMMLELWYRDVLAK